MATWEDVRRIVAGLPETGERSEHDWRFRDKLLVWARPLGKADLAALGDQAPDGPILAARVADVGVKEALLGDNPDVYFTTPHFDGYPSVLVRLDVITVVELEELVTDAWLIRAPKRLAAQFLAGATEVSTPPPASRRPVRRTTRP